MNREPKAPHDFVSVTETDERRWHGASATSPMSHITVTTVGSTSKH